MGRSHKPLNIDDQDQIIHALKTDADEEIFDFVYQNYFSRLYAFCTQYVDDSEAEEIVQDTMIWLWENRHHLIPGNSLKALLFTIVKNKAINCKKKYNNRYRIQQEIIAKYEKTFENPDIYLHNELVKRYNQALDQLSPDLRKVFELSRNENMTHKDIATHLRISPQTVNYRIGKVLQLLRIKLSEYFIFDLIFFVLLAENVYN